MSKYEVFWEITKFGLDDQEFEETGYSRISMSSFEVQADDENSAMREAEKIIRIETEKELKNIKNDKILAGWKGRVSIAEVCPRI